MSARRVVLWRHGRTTFNAENRFQGQLDVPLDDVGRAQAAAAAAHLAGQPIDAVVASDLSRAVETARALTSRTGHALRTDPDLREVHAGAWEGLLGAEIEARWPEEHAAWRRGDDVRVGGGENRLELGTRVAGAVERHASTVEGTLLVVAHGAALKAGVLRLVGLPPVATRALAGFRNGHWAVLTRRGHGWVLEEWNAGSAGASVGAEG
ncbi:histidine phosphatase family protein [Kineococcus aurantiacus]|uniref:Putative phosphoglycerate mutase n=1 Tax=Kineococcus aurantiacus TaxID=37633 RepID=A0A7Y9DJL7_9ACTN|nr:putative phosphoglycerate mutase [Kineococcus aurantiacus]